MCTKVIKVLFLYFDLYQSVMLNSLSSKVLTIVSRPGNSYLEITFFNDWTEFLKMAEGAVPLILRSWTEI
jgi:hypothetical protein